MEKKWDTARNKLEKIGSTTGEALHEIATGIEEAWEDLGQHFGKAIKHFKKEGISYQEQWEFYQDASDKWRWRRTEPDGDIIGSSHTGFQTKEECLVNAQRHGYEEE